MIKIAFRDLQWRSRRVLIAVIGSSLVLALALVMSGLSAGFNNESERTVGLARATNWVIDSGGTGPFLQPKPLDAATVKELTDQVGVDHAAPLTFGRQSVHRPDGSMVGDHEHVNLVGSLPGRLGSPEVTEGAQLSAPGQVVVDVSLGARIGETITLGSSSMKVIGYVEGARLLAGVPNVYVHLADSQRMTFGGQNLATTVVVDRPVTVPKGTKLLSNEAAAIDGLRPVVNAKKTIAMVRTLLWLVAALIVGSVMYLGVLERTKDVAVLKGMGARSTSLAGSMMIQSGLLAVSAALLGVVIAVLIAPMFPLSSEIPRSALLFLPLLAAIVGSIASLGAAKRLFSVQPALAFRN
jgi:putative ABC transport system permease protein